MDLVVIGDRAVGKTSMVASLAHYSLDRDSKVKITTPDPKRLAEDLRPETGIGAGTADASPRELIMTVQRPTGAFKEINVVWIDLPGEIFQENSSRRQNGNEDWQVIKDTIQQSKYVILLLPPHRGMVKEEFIRNAPEELKPQRALPTEEQWRTRLNWWFFDFLNQNCSRARRILISIHKADMFCDVDRAGVDWFYKPERIGTDFWRKYDDFAKSFLGGVRQDIRKYNNTDVGANTDFFITSTVSRDLLQLPWLYIGLYL
ncbi:MAG: hypothetical protein RMZ41_002830 [Nostoc sp. DedVER02]|uniref:hypothetical protein n=1 Tax=unclassified Nostoc TaxID=2593658 RepID=UPI002AD43561|nr:MULTISPECIES: hypothetical protein [unclassified Nostoc]MDZ7986906.1 hypothetical protein [Nostoc sp. DedVER02]MDZ8115808.1 hypothetical protein [Nostoc sp. DedVER01b]